MATSSWTWFSATYNLDVGNNDEYMATFHPPQVGRFHYAYRYSVDGGQTWLYADLDGTGNGYQAHQAGVMTVTTH